MTNPDHKIYIVDESENKYIFRNNEKEYQKPFIFKGYKSEKDRIKETLKQNNFLFNISGKQEKKSKKEKEKISCPKSFSDSENKYNFNIPNLKLTRKRISILEEEKLRDIIKKNIIVQPQMRFKARTDLERVYDALRGKYLRENEKNIVDRQLKNINLNSYQKPKDIIKTLELVSPEDINEFNKDEEEENNEKTYKIKPNPIIEEFKKKEKEKDISHLIYGNGNLYYDPKKQSYLKPWQRNMDLNLEAEGILSEYHIKTHFKACAEVAEKKINYKHLNKNLHKRSYTIGNDEVKKMFDYEDNNCKENDDLINYDNYNKNENPYNFKRNETFDPASLKALSNIAFGKDSIIRGDNAIVEQYIPIGKKNKYYHKRKLVDENSVLIDGKILFKDSQFDVIANKVLKICNVYKKKSRNNDNNLKKRNGKLMVTKGLSVEQFEKKYNFSD